MPKEVKAYAQLMRRRGWKLFCPWLHAPQDDPTGIEIVKAEHAAMLRSDRVVVYRDVNSKGSHFDLGMTFALGKPILLIGAAQKDKKGKSYLKVIRRWWKK